MAWPLIEPIADVSRDYIRRVYLKRMMHLQPDVWTDENFINDPPWWPPANFLRSITATITNNGPGSTRTSCLSGSKLTTNQPP